MARRTVAVAVVALAVAIGACARDAGGTPGRGTGDPTTQPSTSAGTTRPSDTSVGRIELRRTGGFEGLDEGVRIEPGGMVHVRLQGATEFTATGRTLTTADLSALHELVTSEEFLDLEESYIPDDLCCDQFEYLVSVELGPRTVVSMTADGVEETPDILAEVIDVLVPYLRT